MNVEVNDRRHEVAQKLSVGYQWLRNNQLTRAQALFEAVLILEPDNGQAHAYRAMSLLKRARMQSGNSLKVRRLRIEWRRAAATEVEEALRVGAGEPLVHYLCAHVLRELGKPRRALELLELNIAQQPAHETTWLAVARCRMRMRQEREAEAAARRALECAPLSYLSHEVLGWILGNRKSGAKPRPHGRPRSKSIPNRRERISHWVAFTCAPAIGRKPNTILAKDCGSIQISLRRNRNCAKPDFCGGIGGWAS